MDLNEYQKRAMTTCMATCHNLPYMLINLQGEVGELSSKIAKAIRSGKLYFTIGEWVDGDGVPKQYIDRFSPSFQKSEYEAIRKEAGDVLWQLAGVCSVMGFSLEDVAAENLDKLASRKERGKIDGNGDNR